MPNMSQMFPSKWLRGPDLQGQEVPVVVSAVTLEEFDDQEKNTTAQKWCLWFTGKDKGLVLNKTNARTIADFYGDDTDDWMGRTVTLYPAMVTAFGKTTESVRVKVTPDNAQAAVQKDAPKEPVAPALSGNGARGGDPNPDAPVHPDSTGNDSLPF